jgi:hypothetical protein
MGTPVTVRGQILHTPRTAESLQRFDHSRVRKSRTRRASGASRRVIPASDGTGEREGFAVCSASISHTGVPEASGATASTAVANRAAGPISVSRRLLCGLTILQGLQPAGLEHWDDGWLYNPDDGRTYRVSAELRSADVFKARIYLGVPIFGETKTLQRVTRLGLEGWC